MPLNVIMANGCDDLYTCGVDDFSETEIRDAVEHLNYLIDNLIVGILVSNNAQEELKAVAGTYAFGLQRSAEGVRTILVEAKVSVIKFLKSACNGNLLHNSISWDCSPYTLS